TILHQVCTERSAAIPFLPPAPSPKGPTTCAPSRSGYSPSYVRPIQFDLRSIIERPTSGISPLRPPSASLPPLSGDRDPAMHSSSTAASNCFIFRLSTFPDGGLWYRLHNAPTIRDPPPWHSGRQMRPHC